MIPFEKLDNSVGTSKIIATAEETLKKGWRRRNYSGIDLRKAIPWKLQGHEQRSHNFHIQCLDMIDQMLRAYSHSHDQKYLKVSLPIALDWINTHSDSKAQDISPFAWYDMAVGLRSYRLAYLLQATDEIDLLDETKRQMLWSSLEQHANYLADDKNIIFHNNHGYYQIAGQLAMGRRFASQSPTMMQAYQQAILRLRQMLEQQFTPDGIHREHSPDYHRMVYDTLKALIDSGLVEDKAIIESAKRIEEALSWFVYPNQHIVNFGDSDDRSLERSPKEAQGKWTTPEMQFWVGGGKCGEKSSDVMRAFSHGGYWIVRKPGDNPVNLLKYSYLALNAAFHSRTHKHADDLSFVWFDRGHNLLVDAGRYGYIGKAEQGSDLWLDGYWYSNPWRVYCESTRAHNTLEFDDKNFQRKGVKPYGSALQRWGQDASGVMFVEAECKHFTSIRHMRMLFFIPGKWLVILDWFHDNKKEPHKVRQWFHIGHQLQLLVHQEQYLVPITGSAQPLRITHLLPNMMPSRPYMGEENPTIQGWWSARERDIVANYAFCYELPEAESGLYATLFTFSEKLQADRVWSKVNTSGRKGQFRWTDEDSIHELRFERPVDGDIQVSYNMR
jgi:hypothetical protein